MNRDVKDGRRDKLAAIMGNQRERERERERMIERERKKEQTFVLLALFDFYPPRFIDTRDKIPS